MVNIIVNQKWITIVAVTWIIIFLVIVFNIILLAVLPVTTRSVTAWRIKVTRPPVCIVTKDKVKSNLEFFEKLLG